jgi:GntR family transcriptional regulator / MocR family aminotransferase
MSARPAPPKGSSPRSRQAPGSLTGDPLALTLDRRARTPLAEQIRQAVGNAIEDGVLLPGARLPSWRDLATQLGVARGTVRSAYERLLDAQLVTSSRAGGTRVAERPPNVGRDGAKAAALPQADGHDPLPEPLMFQLAVPAPDALPVPLLARLRSKAARAETAAAAVYPDARGEAALRREIAAHLALARGLACAPSQVFVTTGFAQSLSLALRTLRLDGATAWVEDPGFPVGREVLQMAGMRTVPVPVDAQGIVVGHGKAAAPQASCALVTPGQQAPLGCTLSLGRRLELLQWAAAAAAWIIEDDYLGELQLGNHAAPALASLDRAGRTIYLGTFSKTLSPTLRVGFVVVPAALATAFAAAADCLAPAPGPAVQHALAAFMGQGHYLRHLRRMKRVYASRQAALGALLRTRGLPVHPAGLALLLGLPAGADDVGLVRRARAVGLAPSALSPWYGVDAVRQPGLLLGVSTAFGDALVSSCDRLLGLIE